MSTTYACGAWNCCRVPLDSSMWIVDRCFQQPRRRRRDSSRPVMMEQTGIGKSAKEILQANAERLEFMQDNVLFARAERPTTDQLRTNEIHVRGARWSWSHGPVCVMGQPPSQRMCTLLAVPRPTPGAGGRASHAGRPAQHGLL